ncbi:hypothetical protein GCM10027440_43360 [Nocardiopsis coralliicola]
MQRKHDGQGEHPYRARPALSAQQCGHGRKGTGPLRETDFGMPKLTVDCGPGVLE